MNNNPNNTQETREALKRFKMEVAKELGVPLKDGYNGNLTSSEAGKIGGEMVKKMVKSAEQNLR